MDWKLKFISQENFVKHVEATIDKYGEKLESFDIKRFNKNIICLLYTSPSPRDRG